MKIKEFILENPDKVERALNGTPRGDNSSIGGVGGGAYFDGTWKKDGENLNEEAVEKLEDAILAEYDRFGGLIRKNGDKVKTGSFYNFAARKPHETSKVVFQYRVNGKTVDVPAGVELPGEVKAAKILAETEAIEEVGDDGEEKKSKKRSKNK